VKVFVAALILLVAASTFAQDDKKPKRKPQLYDAPTRAYKRALSEETKVFLKCSFLPDISEEDQKILFFFEFGDGTFGIYSGFCDADNDQWVVIDQRNLEMLQECVINAKKKAK
jgi:hypothetical protein